jgi:hypothetical protein
LGTEQRFPFQLLCTVRNSVPVLFSQPHLLLPIATYRQHSIGAE